MFQQLTDNLYNHGFHIIDNFLDDIHYAGLCETIQRLQQQQSFRQGKIGQKSDKTQNSSIRNDQILWLDKQDRQDSTKAYFAAIDQLCQQLNQSLFLGLFDYESHFAIYPPHSYYKKHVDQFATTQDRRISCVYYLNQDWQPSFGGELTLYDQADKILTKTLPFGNRFICFNSDIPHEVHTTYQTRYSIATWLKVRNLGRVDNSFSQIL